jgi:hypothetical protein
VLLIHQSPLGDLEIPTVLGPVPAGEPFEVDNDIAGSLLAQGDLYAPALAAAASAPIPMPPVIAKPATPVGDTNEPATGADSTEVQA